MLHNCRPTVQLLAGGYKIGRDLLDLRLLWLDDENTGVGLLNDGLEVRVCTKATHEKNGLGVWMIFLVRCRNHLRLRADLMYIEAHLNFLRLACLDLLKLHTDDLVRNQFVNLAGDWVENSSHRCANVCIKEGQHIGIWNQQTPDSTYPESAIELLTSPAALLFFKPAMGKLTNWSASFGPRKPGLI